MREGSIFNHFSQYGPIDKIRIVDEIDHTENMNNTSYIISRCISRAFTNIPEHRQRYALVTFATAKSSYNARVRRSHAIDGRNYWIRMADSCYQERREGNLDEIMNADDGAAVAGGSGISATPIPQLNDDCLLKIFSYLDVHTLVHTAETCNRFGYLVTQQTRRKINFRFPPTTFASMEKCLKLFGPDVTHLTLDFGQSDSSVISRKALTAQNKPMILRIYRKIRQLIDVKVLTCLRIESMVVTPAIFAAIKPLLSRLTVLKIKSLRCAEAEEEFEFPAVCTQLTKLKLIGTILLDKSAAVHWPSLTNLSILDNYNLRATTMNSFLSKNPQLTRLRVSCGLYDNINFNNFIDDTLKYQISPGLEKLTYEDKWNGRQSTVFFISPELGQLKSLRKLNLCFRFNYINDENINTILQLQDLTDLTLRYNFNLNAKQIIRPIRSHHLIALAQGLPNLEIFRLHGFQPSESAVIDFVKYADNLRVLNIRGCMRPLNYEFHQNILKANSNIVIY